jgi:hypothetical protein
MQSYMHESSLHFEHCWYVSLLYLQTYIRLSMKMWKSKDGSSSQLFYLTLYKLSTLSKPTRQPSNESKLWVCHCEFWHLTYLFRKQFKEFTTHVYFDYKLCTILSSNWYVHTYSEFLRLTFVTRWCVSPPTQSNERNHKWYVWTWEKWMGAKLTVALNYSMVNVCSEHISKVWARVTLTLDWVTLVTLTVTQWAKMTNMIHLLN